MQLKALLAEATDFLNKAGVQSPKADAELLLCYVLDCERSDLQLKLVMGVEADSVQLPKLQDLLAQRANHIPVQHLTGKAPFRYLELSVGPGVFIPRPETELLVEIATPHIKVGSIVVDLCSGSGAIAASVATEFPDVEVYAVELSQKALPYLRENTKNLTVNIVQGDLNDALPELESKVDIILSNPPYVPETDIPKTVEVAKFDPQLALYGGNPDGTKIPAQIIERAEFLLKPGGFFAMEHAESQQNYLVEVLANSRNWQEVEKHNDLTGSSRFVSAVKC
ncbi:MAG: peptide chain release factor N(5)-glutamine methyltransferase [Micrococcaceae bacterium]